jgi:site-specific recombinase XerD
MIEDMQVRNLAPHTQRAYLQQVSLFSRHFGKSPEVMGPEEIRAYQVHLTHERGLSASSILVVVSAIRFLYKVTLKRTWSVDEVVPTCRKPQKLPTVLSREEVARFLDATPSLKHQVILTLCYATGLRVSEALALTSSAIDSQRMVIRVEEGKGRKDRQVMLSPRLLDLLRQYWRAEHPRGWLFPGDVPGQPISAFAVQHACKAARRRSGIVKPVRFGAPVPTIKTQLRRALLDFKGCLLVSLPSNHEISPAECASSTGNGGERAMVGPSIREPPRS